MKMEVVVREIELLKGHIECTMNDPSFQSKFTGPNAPDKAMWMNEARAYLIKCVGKFEKVLEVEG